MIRRDESSSDVFVFDQSDSVWNAGGAAESQRGIQSGIRHADHDVRLNRVCFCQTLPGPQTGCMNGYPVQNGIRPGKIDILKNTMAWMLFSAMLPPGLHTAFAENQDFARIHIPDQGRADSVQRTAF